MARQLVLLRKLTHAPRHFRELFDVKFKESFHLLPNSPSYTQSGSEGHICQLRRYRRGAQPPVTVSEILRPGNMTSRSPPAGAYGTVGVGPLSGEMPRMS